jgi:hypothetical protein
MNAPQNLNVDDVINVLAKIKSEKESLTQQLKELNLQKDAFEKELMQLMEKAGLQRASNGVATVSISEDVVYNATDWDAIYAHIQSSGDFSLLHRRLSNAAIREMDVAGENVPGTEAVTLQKVLFRSL